MARRFRMGQPSKADLEFIGRPLCAGDYGIIADSAADPANCPICKRASQTDEVGDPERRFAVNVVRYTMNREFTKPISPFACQIIVWPFTDKTYNTLTDIKEESGNLKGRDLLLKCTNEPYQNYDIQAGSTNLWQSSDAIKETVVATYQGNRVADLERACGRKAETRWMMKDLDTIAERWRIARGEKSVTDNVGSSAGLDDGLADLLGSRPAAHNEQRPVDMGDLLGGGSDSTDAIASATAKGQVLDIDSVLESLK